jgi:hypothetical protein
VATADTARLIAALELQDKFSKPLSDADRKLAGFERRVGGMSRGVSTAVGNIARIGAGAAVAGIGLLAVNVKAGVDSLNELENVTVATNTVLKSTKGISGQTAAGVRELSEGFEDLNATMDDKVIQSGANMLLTFTNIREKAFEPALEAALNMNEAMGGGPEGLQGTIIQVGKALNDPIKGVTALRRVGVQLTKQQEDQIKTLVEQNNLYGAQQIILEELTTQFGGRFAAAGDTAAGKQAALADRIEDVQKALAGPLMPALDRARDKLIEVLGSPQILAGAERLGDAIAGLFSEPNLERGASMIEDAVASLSSADFTGFSSGFGTLASSVGGLPWEAIGSAATLLGTGAKAMLDVFTSMPPWVQTAVLTGWGLNKLTGGALGGIVGELGKGLIKGVLGMNAGVVNINAAAVNGPGGGVPGVGGKGGGFLGGLKTGGALASIPLAGVAAVEVSNFTDMRDQAMGGLQSTLDGMPRKTGAEIDKSMAAIEGQISQDRPFLEGILFNTNVKPQLEAELAELRELKFGTDSIDRNMLVTADRMQRVADRNRAIESAVLADTAMLNSVRAATDRLGPRIDRVANTPHKVQTDVNLTVPVNISATVLANTLYRTTTSRSYSAGTSTNTGGI